MWEQRFIYAPYYFFVANDVQNFRTLLMNLTLEDGTKHEAAPRQSHVKSYNNISFNDSMLYLLTHPRVFRIMMIPPSLTVAPARISPRTGAKTILDESDLPFFSIRIFCWRVVAFFPLRKISLFVVWTKIRHNQYALLPKDFRDLSLSAAAISLLC